jgi:hypothetical protein
MRRGRRGPTLAAPVDAWAVEQQAQGETKSKGQLKRFKKRRAG